MKKRVIILLLFTVLCATAFAQSKRHFQYDRFTRTITGYTGRDKSITIPDMINFDNLTRIGEGAFFNKGLTKVTISTRFDNFSYIGKRAFADNLLTSIVIPVTVSSIDNLAFSNNPLKSIVIGNNVIVANDAFDHNFASYYNSNDRKAGMYTLDSNNTWVTKRSGSGEGGRWKDSKVYMSTGIGPGFSMWSAGDYSGGGTHFGGLIDFDFGENTNKVYKSGRTAVFYDAFGIGLNFAFVEGGGMGLTIPAGFVKTTKFEKTDLTWRIGPNIAILPAFGGGVFTGGSIGWKAGPGVIYIDVSVGFSALGATSMNATLLLGYKTGLGKQQPTTGNSRPASNFQTMQQEPQSGTIYTITPRIRAHQNGVPKDLYMDRVDVNEDVFSIFFTGTETGIGGDGEYQPFWTNIQVIVLENLDNPRQVFRPIARGEDDNPANPRHTNGFFITFRGVTGTRFKLVSNYQTPSWSFDEFTLGNPDE